MSESSFVDLPAAARDWLRANGFRKPSDLDSADPSAAVGWTELDDECRNGINVMTELVTRQGRQRRMATVRRLTVRSRSPLARVFDAHVPLDLVPAPAHVRAQGTAPPALRTAAPDVNSIAAGCGPRAAIDVAIIRSESAPSLQAWLDEARLEAILGSCPRSINYVKSGFRCYLEFARRVCKDVTLPPKLDYVLSYSLLFRNPDTFSNYLGHLRTACLVANVDATVLYHPAVRRAKQAIRKRLLFAPRPRHFITGDILQKFIGLARELPGEWERPVALFALTYVFLLRLPSEALPITWDGGGFRDGSPASLVWSDNRLGLRLARRKNKERGSTLWRSCWCKPDSPRCPVHYIVDFVSRCPEQAPLFGRITAKGALGRLRCALRRCNVQEPNLYRTHDLRRGHCRDLQAARTPLHEILALGEWRSPSFLKYMNLEELEYDAVLEAHLGESSDSDCD